MSVRRLAEDAVQPNEFAFNPSNAAWAERKIKDYPEGREASAVIPLLMRAQEQEGWVTKAAIEYIGGLLNMPLIRVLEVATFYTQFQLAPVGKRAHIQVCGTTPCMLRGAGDLINACKKRIAPKPFELSADGNLSWEEVECQGACVNAPMVMIFKDSYEDLTADRLEEIIDQFDAGKGDEVPVGPQIDRIFSAPEGGLTSLTNDPVVKGGAKAKKLAASSGAKAKTASAPASLVSQVEEKAPVAQKATEKKTETKKAEAAKTAVKKPAVKKASAKKAEAPTLSDKDKPKAIKRPKTPDDLKLISGVGPKIEGILHELGIFTFAQVAEWKKAERDWVDGYLKFKGRIDRDEWVKQAKALAKGGRDEYVRVFGKEPR